ncbi:hypothetical protein EW146_g252 [Bondarzewia mesenterica]|uniref:GST N-terminal domain-containing protein n=1 Tax=Bondarzewia mesenterica TaxID=1095465 RepID=A0A4S4M7K0_9AGAM|nr:hypothetical protein EW146_g252 [Bondarzewia mesenterica]
MHWLAEFIREDALVFLSIYFITLLALSLTLYIEASVGTLHMKYPIRTGLTPACSLLPALFLCFATPGMSDTDIILYDIPGTASKDKDWSPNVWKTRFVLNYKKLPHRTSWIEYPDIAALCAELNVPSSAIRRDGSPYYTVPFIYDPLTCTHVSDSLPIAQYLERTYPDSPRLFPDGMHAALRAFEDMWHDRVLQHLFPLMTNLNDLAPVEKHPELWDRVRTGLGRVDAYMNANGEDPTKFWLGDRVSYADVTMAGWLVWVKRVLGSESNEWRNIVGWHGGRWGRLMEEFERWEFVDSPKARL